MTTLGYKYLDETAAQLAVKQCNDHYGYPKPDCLTNTVCEYYYDQHGDFYYIEGGDFLRQVLGEPEVFEISMSPL